MIPLSQQAWDWLRRELDTWQQNDLRPSFWWRDDDAVSACAELQRLAELSAAQRIPLALAVIPARIEDGLANLLDRFPQVSILQHGFAHQNHAAPGQRSLELGGKRAPRQIYGDLRQGFRLLEQQFGDSFLPVLVPPWNRMDPALIARLPELGFRGLSAARARKTANPGPGILQVNAHLDPILWRQGRGFIGVYPAVAILVQHLRSRRLGYRDRAEPSGLLSHHLAQNPAVWKFLEDLLTFLSAHPAVDWFDAREIWLVQANP